MHGLVEPSEEVGLVAGYLLTRCDLRYESQREAKKYRALRWAQKIRTRLGGSANMMDPFPEKPKGMHHDTYMRLFWKHHEAEMEQLAGACGSGLTHLNGGSARGSSFGSFRV